MVKKAKSIAKKVMKKKALPVSAKYKIQSTIYDLLIVGGGPAGLMAACKAGESGAKVLVLEKNNELGKKLLISGGGRCNLTNANPNHREFVSKYGKKGSFLFSPFSVFGVQDTIRFFNDLGLKTKIEPGFRVFPESDRSEDVLDVLVKDARRKGVEFRLGANVVKVNKKKDEIVSVTLENKEVVEARKFILTTGGMSHPETGSTGDGFKWLKELGHKVADINPSLVPIKIKESFVADLSGISLDNVGISVWQDNKKALNKKGRVLFTHVGLSGPTILNMSKAVGELLDYSKDEVKIVLDFFPGTGLDQMHDMMKKIFAEHINKKVKNLAFKEVPAKVYELIIKQLDIDPEWEINEIKREERFALIEKFKKFEMTVAGLLGFDKAIITSGGLELTEIDFKTMKSKLIKNLYVAGDVLDFDRPSGGFSLQLCWTTGYVAGKSAGVIK
ncbi:MAG: NAD(P)/FAD-dependent oxidoreductase [bacterium]